MNTLWTQSVSAALCTGIAAVTRALTPSPTGSTVGVVGIDVLGPVVIGGAEGLGLRDRIVLQVLVVRGD
ncbi:MAG: hypothetical protein QOH68_27, partial [Nocardioidaceae bacterium]|nr:hypothetical protein [Nocardioidaceae bacterium]